ncbi:LysR family transcriptional regulator [Thermophilibacter sp. ET337]|uniref:LysR family transcriptional regulator n=1 Tax=Thermophilibacter sp. ET337 TaxID=2973084 RepID=UPI0021ABC1A5|nr:LysR family transcriptional regulator [Thermophilibacter sp. ET337]MCR8908560.1 LysR family transcriptional regulator [Thermophilibacter sp. ET337]
MTIEQLEHIACVARTGSISRAAAELHMSQPALSRSIRRLEDELGCGLLRRTANRSALTEAGRIAADYADDLLRTYRRMRDELSSLETRRRTLRIGTCAPAPLWRVTQLVVETTPGTIVASESLDEQHLRRGLMEDTLDATITLNPLALPGFISQPIMTESLSVLLPRTHPLASKQTLRFCDIDGETFLIYTNIGFWRSIVERELPHATFLWQDDRSMFEMLLPTSDALAFSTDASGPYTAHESDGLDNRVAVPLSDASARATFYLVYRTDGQGRGSELIERVLPRLSR